MSDSSSLFSQDLFTERLLKVYYDLHLRGAFLKKKEFTNTIGITHNYFHLLERNLRNYGSDEEKRMKARAGLFEKFGVNPDYLKGVSSQMYLREPEVKRTEVVKKNEVEVSYYGKKQKAKLEEELKHYKQRVEELETQVMILQEALAQYEMGTRTDNSDKSR